MREKNGILILTNDEMKDFTASLFSLSEEESEQRQRQVEEIRESIHVQETEDGFSADFDSLDSTVFEDGRADVILHSTSHV